MEVEGLVGNLGVMVEMVESLGDSMVESSAGLTEEEVAAEPVPLVA